jgi:hypothetical protein
MPNDKEELEDDIPIEQPKQPLAKRKGGRATTYNEKDVALLLTAISEGLTIQQACKACAVPTATLQGWKKKNPELVERFEAAREQARRKALAAIQKAGDKDYRAWVEFLKLGFREDYKPNYYTQTNVGVQIQQPGQLYTEEERMRLIAMRERLLAEQDKPAAIDGQFTSSTASASKLDAAKVKALPARPNDQDVREAREAQRRADEGPYVERTPELP